MASQPSVFCDEENWGTNLVLRFPPLAFWASTSFIVVSCGRVLIKIGLFLLEVCAQSLPDHAVLQATEYT